MAISDRFRLIRVMINQVQKKVDDGTSLTLEEIDELHDNIRRLHELRNNLVYRAVKVEGRPLDEVAPIFGMSPTEIYQLVNGTCLNMRITNSLLANCIEPDETQYFSTKYLKHIPLLGKKSLEIIFEEEKARGIIRTRSHYKKPPTTLSWRKKVEIVTTWKERYGRVDNISEIFPITPAEVERIRNRMSVDR